MLHSKIVRIFKIIGVGIAFILATLFIIPLLFSDTINTKVKTWANANINGQLAFEDINLSFFKHFPALTVTLYEVNLKGSVPFEKETLFKAKELALGINLSTLLEERIVINKFFVDHADIHVLVDSLGNANYNVYKSTKKQTSSETSSETSLGIELIKIENSKLTYHDESLPMHISAKGFNYTGKGDLSKAIFDLYTEARIDSVDFTYAGQNYFKNKKIDANLITKINTSSLAFVFEKNDILINRLPVTFNGKFEFLENGYDMSFDITSKKSQLKDIFTALPPDYLGWLDETDIKGLGEIAVSLKGQYIAEQNKMPDFNMNLAIRDGYIAHQKASIPVKNLFLNMDASLPKLDPELLYLNIDSIYFNVNDDFFSGILKVNGLSKPKIHTNIKAKMDLEQLDRALGITAYDVKGLLTLNLQANGKYATTIKKTGVRKTDTLVSSIPTFKLNSKLQNGYFKVAQLPQAIRNIRFNLEAACADSLYQNTYLNISDLNLNVLSNYIKGYAKIANLKTYPVDIKLNAKFNLADVASFYPLDSLILKGKINMAVLAKGTYEPKKRKFPVTKANLSLQNGLIKSAYSPLPIEQIEIQTAISSSRGSYKDIKVNILPISFNIANQPFKLQAQLQNFSNLKYSITSKGNLDISKIYQVFAVKGYDVSGFIQTDFNLSGLQSDATAKRYHRLNNKGNITVDDLALQSDLFPLPFYIKNGKFSFYQDKLRFDNFKGIYGETTINLNGYLNNIIDYALKEEAPLKGNFNIYSAYINANQFMAFADAGSTSTVAPANAGVIMIPQNLDLSLNATVKKINYDGLNISNFKGQVISKNQTLELKDTGFELAGAKTTMNASYKPLNPKRAQFYYQIKAENFDIQKVYKEVKMFRDMASAAKNAYGHVSLNYQLSGKLNESMYPIMPSLAGKGSLTLNNIKFKGFKLLNQIARKSSYESLEDADVNKVEIKSSIKNNIMTIERTKMRMAGFRPRFEGQVSLNGNMNMAMRIGLPPLGIIGIPVKITGTQEKPVIKIGRQTKADELEETTEE
ncbi:AsmA-like C-terminal region-containing protein [Pedobacter glucosidilyticus]|uniref:AsmA family protein n=1 Tax=Pedobacter glucosidilyticus TaxID=1122941 RepID=UPI0004087395|nr:AsmA-like C-terminal region-containing protein [Pedobacter glucosidilyticus]